MISRLVFISDKAVKQTKWFVNFDLPHLLYLRFLRLSNISELGLNYRKLLQMTELGIATRLEFRRLSLAN